MGYHVCDSSDYSDTNDVQLKKLHKCTFEGCTATFSKKMRLESHIRKHTGERPFACDQPGCSKTYTNNSHLRRHKKVSHEEESQEVTCSYEGCGLVLSNKYNLKRHISRKHNPDRKFPFQCTICPQSFLKKKQLQRHTYIHTEVAAFGCDKCDLRFQTSYDLKRHHRNHRTYTCEDCKAEFQRWTLLCAHRRNECRRHNLNCEKCGKTFKTQFNLKNHAVTHKEKGKRTVFPCPRGNCLRFYFEKKNLVIHIKTFHIGAVHLQLKCSYGGCNAVLKTKLTHKRHLLWHSLKKKKKVVRKERKDKGESKYLMSGLMSGFQMGASKTVENNV